MATAKNILDEYLKRASLPNQPVGLQPAERMMEPRPPILPEAPRVYGGTPPSEGAVVGEMLAARNRSAARKTSPFNVMLMLLGAAIIIVLYISNIIAVGRLLNQVNLLQQQYQRTLNDQEQLKAQVNRMSSLDRIQKIAEKELGLQNPATAPQWLTVDEEKIKALNEAAQKRQQPLHRK